MLPSVLWHLCRFSSLHLEFLFFSSALTHLIPFPYLPLLQPHRRNLQHRHYCIIPSHAPFLIFLSSPLLSTHAPNPLPFSSSSFPPAPQLLPPALSRLCCVVSLYPGFRLL
ncbi:hypothetical protein Fmac_023144 [Flemingia macrophylla]|uniref:Uncharacterized protein n=1 Tax=Flemingia macrophylla TaxID=520843 RepID=A0ABD1LKM7_9FABA